MMRVTEIGKALDQIWYSLEGSRKMRASLFNLLVVTLKNPRTPYIREITHRVVQRFPSRVIFITLDHTLPAGTLDASVSMIPTVPGSHEVACDWIELTSSESSQSKIPLTILPLLLPDLPIYLLWAEEPFEDRPLSAPLEQLATRVIFDSEVASHLPTFANSLLEHHQKTGCAIADLNWARTESWRELLAATFYSPKRLLSLQNAQRITITYNSRKTEALCHTTTQALYLQSWLGAQLGWSLQKATSHQFDYRGVTIQLCAEESGELPPGTVISIEITTLSQTHFSFIRDKHYPYQVNTVICDEEKCDIPSKFIFTKSQSGLSLVNEICHKGTSSHFKNVLHFLTKLPS